MDIDDLITLLPALFQFLQYIIVYPLTMIFNAAVGIFSAEINFVAQVFQTIVNTVIDIFNLFAWLPVPVKLVFICFMGLLVVLLTARIVGRVIQFFYPSGVGD